METLNQNKKWLAIIEFIASIILGIILLPIGFIFGVLIYPFFDKRYLFRVFIYLDKMLGQLYTISMKMLHNIALSIDIIGNIIAGDMLEVLVTKERDTWFFNKKHTISQALGYLEHNNKLNKFGKLLSNLLSIIFGKDHCVNAYKSYCDENNTRNNN